MDIIIHNIRSAPPDLLSQMADNLLHDRLPRLYLATLSDNEKIDALRACLTIWALTQGAVVPRVFQIQASLAMLQRRDSVITAGTGCGKTLCLLIPMLLRPESMTITISPLKRLQTTQVLECQKYNISTIAINEDTPNDATLWEMIRTGRYQHLIVSPEQLGMYNGHLPRLARLIRQDQSFNKRISHVHVDEAHNIYTAGLAHHGEDAFRPAYGKLGEFRVLLPKTVPFQALSATLPPHVLSAVKQQLSMSSDCLEINLSTNRANITYATIPIIGSLRNFHNFDLLLPDSFHPPMAIPKTLVFHDSKRDATEAAAYVDARLPQNLQNLGIVKHYHSDMSPEYLQQTFEDFSSPDGTCRILHATAGASTGLDIRGVLVVIQYGICKNMAEAAQRAGRAVRDQGLHGLSLTMVEPWALELSLVDADGQTSDPDRPYTGIVKKTSSKRDRTSYASLHFAQSKTCLRKLFAAYLNDQSPEALSYSARWCCDRHNDGFNLLSFFHGEVYTGDTEASSAGATTKRKRNHLRPIAERQQLLDTLVAWREQAHAEDPYRGVWPITRLLDNDGLELVSKTHPTDITSPSDLVALLEESDAWGSEYGTKIYTIITQFDQAKSQVPRVGKSSETRAVKRAKQAGTVTSIMYTFAPVQTPESFVSTV